MSNPHVEARLLGIQQTLLSIYNASAPLSNNVKGFEREIFVGNFLSEVMPPVYRFGTGDITDSHNEKSGQCDIVVEVPFLFSFPTYTKSPRLFLAEGVAAVVEVKSNVMNQWAEIARTAEAVKKLKRKGISGSFHLGAPPEKIPVFVVGYKGWSNIETIVSKVDEGIVDGILVIENGMFFSRLKHEHGLIERRGQGIWGLWNLLATLYDCTVAIASMHLNLKRYEP